MGQSLCCNKTLKMLDLSCNRVYEYCLPPLVDALEKNNTLEVLKVRHEVNVFPKHGMFDMYDFDYLLKKLLVFIHFDVGSTCA